MKFLIDKNNKISNLIITKTTIKGIVMASNFNNYSSSPVYDLCEFEQEGLSEAIEAVLSCCQMIDINILFIGIFYVILPQDVEVGFSEEIQDAIGCISEYCYNTDSMIWITGDYLYISRYVSDFAS